MLQTTDRDRLAALADALIPGSASFPSASAAGVSAGLIDRAVDYRPDLATSLHEALRAAGDLEATAALDSLAADHPDLFTTLTTLVAGAYFQSPQVQTALNYRPAPRPAHDDADSYVDMLEAVVERGFDIHGADLA